ncbi:MAG: S1 RNA-binding domain-containing protein [Myxococcales bacterium]|nr:S1 RNA-binding domain-containing protein [Myxococcales bacterium]
MVEPSADDDFEALLREDGGRPMARVETGQAVRGRVLHVGDKHAVLDLGHGLEGMLDLGGFVDKDGSVRMRVGDSIDAFVQRAGGRMVLLTRALGRGQASMQALQEAAASGLPVEGTVTATNKGGYAVDVSGVACFCPHAQIDLRRVDDPLRFVGQHLRFRVTEVRGGRDVVLSRRALLEADNARKAEQTRQTLAPGVRVSGTVTAVRDFGAFVDVGGLEGFVPASELAWGRRRPEDVVGAGDVVEVEVMRIESGVRGERVVLSLKASSQDPFQAIAAALEPGVVLDGTVTRVEAFGAFVELVPGVEGLVHVSAFGRRIGKPADVAQPGLAAIVKVDGVDPVQRRVSLFWVERDQLDAVLDPDARGPDARGGLRVRGRARPPAPDPRGPRLRTERDTDAEGTAQAAARLAAAPRVPMQDAPKLAPGILLEVTVDKVEPFGAFVAWPGGRGLVPVAELGLPHGTDARRAVPVGTVFKAAVLEVRPDGKVRLSKRAAVDAEERAEAQAWLTQAANSSRAGSGVPGSGVGTLGEALLQKFGPGGFKPVGRVGRR